MRTFPLPAPIRALGFLGVLLAAFASAPARADPASEPYRPRPDELVREIAARRERVEEFAYLREWGRTNGVRIYLAGGTAAGFAHYVRADLEQRSRIARGLEPFYAASRFGYDYFDVFRTTQDADIVIDIPGGAAERVEAAARKLEREIDAKFHHTTGGRSDWEVRFLRFDRGVPGQPNHKDALFSPDFLGQNTDSQSRGLIELTSDPAGRSPVVRDVAAWDAERSPFLEDVVEGRLRFFRAARHAGTRRAAAGLNPEILGAIRAYVKAFQSGFAIDPASRRELEAIVAAFRPEAIVDAYVARSIEKTALKLFTQSDDLEAAWNEVERIGLRKKLLELATLRSRTEFAAWLRRKPLPSFAVGSGGGATAAELGLDVVAHGTSGASAFDSLTRSRLDAVNAFLSVRDQDGQRAIHGDAFYVSPGRAGAGRTGFTLRFRLRPNARHGADFEIVEENGLKVVKILNRRALVLLDEDLKLSPLEYFRKLNEGFAHDDVGVFQKLARRVKARIERMDPTEAAAIADEIRRGWAPALAGGDARKIEEALDRVREWFETSMSKRFPALVEELLAIPAARPWVFQRILANPLHGDRVEWVRRAIGDADRTGKLPNAVRRAWEAAFAHAHWARNADAAALLRDFAARADAGALSELAHLIAEQPEWAKRPEVLAAIFANPNLGKYAAYELVNEIADPALARTIAGRFARTFLQPKTAEESRAVADLIFMEHRDRFPPALIEAIAEEPIPASVKLELLEKILSRDAYRDRPDLLRKLVGGLAGPAREDPGIAAEATYYIERTHWKNHPHLVELCGGAPTFHGILAKDGPFRCREWLAPAGAP